MLADTVATVAATPTTPRRVTGTRLKAFTVCYKILGSTFPSRLFYQPTGPATCSVGTTIQKLLIQLVLRGYVVPREELHPDVRTVQQVLFRINTDATWTYVDT